MKRVSIHIPANERHQYGEPKRHGEPCDLIRPLEEGGESIVRFGKPGEFEIKVMPNKWIVEQ